MFQALSNMIQNQNQQKSNSQVFQLKLSWVHLWEKELLVQAQETIALAFKARDKPLASALGQALETQARK